MQNNDLSQISEEVESRFENTSEQHTIKSKFTNRLHGGPVGTFTQMSEKHSGTAEKQNTRNSGKLVS